MSGWAGRIVIVVWVALGAVVVWLSPKAEPPSPVLAEEVYGAARSMQSSAKAGLLAFARTLERLGYDVGANTKVGAPEADVLFLIEPVVVLSEGEIAALARWVEQGGRLVYAPVVVTVTVSDDANKEKPQPKMDLVLDDPLSQALVAKRVPSKIGEAAFYDVGAGLAVLLPSGKSLSNEVLRAQGLMTELPWLRRVLDGRHRIHFDEARLLLLAQDDLFTLLFGSRYRSALLWGLLALAVWFWSSFVRRAPVRRETLTVGRAFADHLDAVAFLLRSSARVGLAYRALVAGTTHRLGGLISLPHARVTLERPAPQSASDLLKTARALAELERELLRMGQARPHAK